MNKSIQFHNPKQNVLLEGRFQKDNKSTVMVADIMDTVVVTAEENMTMIEVRTLTKHSGVLQMPGKR